MSMEGTVAEGIKEAMFYQPQTEGTVECALCAHRCRIRPGHRGICGVRENRDGTLYTLVYGRLIASNVDPIEKKPLFHFLPGTLSYSIATVGCNFQCGFCQNWDISQITKGDTSRLPGQYAPPEYTVEQAMLRRCRSISYTYTEPTIFFEYAYNTALLAHERGLKNIFVTNGYQTPEVVARMVGVIDAANVDLKSFSEEFYRRICKARLEPVLETIRGFHQAGIWLEVTTLVVPGQNDSEEELGQIARFLADISPNIPWHVSRFYPDYQMTDAQPTPLETIYRALEIGAQAGLRYRYLGNLPGRGYEDTICPHCQGVVVRRLGFNVGEIHLKGDRCGYCKRKLPIVVG